MRAISEYMTESEARAVARWDVGSCLRIVFRYLASKNSVTLKTGLRFIQGHWKWRHLIDRIRVSISVP